MLSLFDDPTQRPTQHQRHHVVPQSDIAQNENKVEINEILRVQTSDDHQRLTMLLFVRTSKSTTFPLLIRTTLRVTLLQRLKITSSSKISCDGLEIGSVMVVDATDMLKAPTAFSRTLESVLESSPPQRNPKSALFRNGGEGTAFARAARSSSKA
jgi:hypothetical protein